MQLLVVEDNEHVAGALVSVLGKHGYEVIRAADGATALAELNPRTDLVLLDLALPDMDGFEVCRRIRKVADTPIIMVTARTQLDARVRGLELGADDYVTKPYDVREVLARIDAVLRRGRAREWDGRQEAARVAVAGMQIDLAAREVRRTDDSLVSLTRKEYDLLALLVRHRGTALARERILREVWGSSWKGLGRTLEVHVASLRRKLGAPAVVETVRGVGYRVAGPA
ncbi:MULTISPECIES: response regulator transcription factor [Isoptericola]|uniref:Sensory transduction protein RegX3 n=1 Tax=Isoptericola sediminis TaxID=2733572 RepID=A0A849JT77_9MICO|nr:MULTISPECIES: response regulator transcription factor [unclassified Isoptericola]MDO8143603.1 response regulator transcription factor [Isoptericola sp. 178]MDO8147469.1 response regulator transcription factor [Isoptericola sp. b515]MDO8150222.1 response regulator transcription factor [Isoptericola sp. b408]NNU26606.1 response regulator transcription factor [Isoptericola sediminis]